MTDKSPPVLVTPVIFGAGRKPTREPEWPSGNICSQEEQAHAMTKARITNVFCQSFCLARFLIQHSDVADLKSLSVTAYE